MRNHTKGDFTTQPKEFKKLITKVNARYFVKDATDDLKTAMLWRELLHSDQDHNKVAERLFPINQDLKHHGNDITKLINCKMMKLILPKSIKPQTKFMYVNKGVKNLHDI